MVVIELQKLRPTVVIPELINEMKIGADRIGDANQFQDVYRLTVNKPHKKLIVQHHRRDHYFHPSKLMLLILGDFFT